MIELKWENIRGQDFQQGLEKLAHTNLPFKVGYHIGRIKAKVVSEANLAQEEFVKLVKKYGELDEATGQFKIKDENKELWTKEATDFSATKFTIEKHRVNIADLGEAKLSPNEIMALEPILLGLEALEGGANGKN